MTPTAPARGWTEASSAVPDLAWRAPSGDPEIGRCSACGGHGVNGECGVCRAPVVTTPARRDAARCRGCHAVFVPVGDCPACGGSDVESGVPRPDVDATGVIPFSIGPDAVQVAAARWLGGGWFHPWRLLRVLRTGAFRPVYVSCWVFTGRTDAEWRGRVGTDRIDRVYEPAEAAWRTRTLTDWRWQTDRHREDPRPRFFSGTRTLPARSLATLAAHHDSADVRPAGDEREPTILADRPLGEAWSEAQAMLREDAREACRRALPGPVRDLSVLVDVTDERWQLVSVPIWVASWWSRDGVRFVLCHGRTGEVVGARPVDWRAVRLAVFFALSPGVALVLLGVPLIFVFAVGVPVMLSGLVALGLGSIASVVAWSSALGSEDE